MPVDATHNGWFCSITPDNCESSDIISKEDILNRIIIVGAVKNTKNGFVVPKWSNYGDNVSIYAPGVNIYSTVNDGYDTLSGTLMAAPIVAAISALTWSVNPRLSGKEVRDIICDVNNVKHMVSDSSQDYTLVNANFSVIAAAKTIDIKLWHCYIENIVSLFFNILYL